MRFLFAFIAFLWALPAYAGAVLVPMPPLLADGTTAGTVRLYVAGVANPRVKVKSDDGKVGPVVASADGTVTFPFTPERATAVGTVALSVTMGTEITTVNVPVVPTFSGDLSVTFDPPFVPSTTSATVRVTPSQQSAVAAERRRFLLTASVGTVEAPVPSGNGTWIARYTPPKGMTTPTNVVFAAADASAPDAVYGYGLLPVTVRRSVSFDAPAGSSNLLTVGDRSYGPLPAAPSGKVAFDVDVDPRFLQGKLTTIAADGSKQEKSVDLPDAGKAQVAILSIGPVVPAGGSSRVRLVVFQPGGKEHTDTSVKLTVSAGAISEPKYSGGAYEATFTAPGTAGDVTLTAEADGVKVEQKLKVVAAAGSVTLTSDPAEIPTGATSIKLVARVKDGTGTAVTGKVPVFTILSGGTLSGTPRDNGDGSYTATVKLTSGTNLLRAAVSPQLPVSGAAPVRLVAWPAASIVAANGKDEVTVNVVALDPYGLPVPNVDLKLGVPMGDGSLPPSASTGASGVARVTYKAGTSAGLGAVHVEGAGLAADLPLYQTTDGMGPTLPVAGPPDIEAAVARWQGAAPTTSVIRTGTAPLAGPPAAVSVATVPPYTTPGAAILVTVRVLDAAGKGVPSQKLTVTASPGTAGSITDNHDGSYVLPVQLPAGVDGPLTISVGAASATGSVVLPTLANAAAASGSQATRTTGPTTGGTTTGGGGAKTTQAAAVSDHAKLRLGAALVNARGSYEQTGNGGSQLLGAASFTTPGAGFFGINADASFWFVNADWGSLGLDARGHAQLEMFKLLDDPYLNVQRDIIAGARYRRGEGALSFTGGLGFHYTTGVLFRYSDAALSDAVLLNFPLYGARLAAGGMLEVGKTYAILELAETFAPFPVDTHAEGLVEYQVSTIGVRGGLTWDYRTMKFGTDDGGEAKVKQSQVSVVVGVGYKL